MYQPLDQQNFYKQILEISQELYTAEADQAALFSLNFDAIHNTFTGPKHPLHEECIVPHYLMPDK